MRKYGRVIAGEDAFFAEMKMGKTTHVLGPYDTVEEASDWLDVEEEAHEELLRELFYRGEI